MIVKNNEIFLRHLIVFDLYENFNVFHCNNVCENFTRVRIYITYDKSYLIKVQNFTIVKTKI